jgi:preprotein translocase subunit YajC
MRALERNTAMSRQLIKMSGWTVLLSSLFIVYGQDKSAPASPLGSFSSMLPMMAIMFAVVYFLMIRPEQKKQKARQAMLAAVKKGDRVITAAGIIGKVGDVKDTTMMVKIADNTVVEFTKSAITSVINKDGTEKQPEKNGVKKTS